MEYDFCKSTTLTYAIRPTVTSQKRVSYASRVEIEIGLGVALCALLARPSAPEHAY